MADKSRLSKLSTDDVNTTLTELTATIAKIKKEQSWFFPGGINQIDVNFSFGLTGVASFEVNVAGPASSGSAADVSAPGKLSIDVDDPNDHQANKGDTITWQNNRPDNVVVYFDDPVYGCPFDPPNCNHFPVKAGKTWDTIVRKDACGPYPHHTESSAVRPGKVIINPGMPRIIIQ
ncbi:MAG TPA: hypothetical protein VIX19_21835 [Terriglobales bacterium]